MVKEDIRIRKEGWDNILIKNQYAACIVRGMVGHSMNDSGAKYEAGGA